MLLPNKSCDISDVLRNSVLEVFFLINFLLRELSVEKSGSNTNLDKGVSLSFT